ncbi:hypothetical protein [Actinomyces sp.]|uniref:hypothetical protein n=1 Tax=Actinomyces sp. TaxID=29317 RepID=UPI0026DAF5B7|nr:hypothetical protein [Actinomyces sp.]MDO4899786.1 hypothetical protein [Actinomyces sp.]
MNRRILSVIIAVLGLIAIVLAVCSATVWRPNSTARASLAQNPDQRYVITEPGVLSLVDTDVEVSATAASADEQVLIAVGHAQDVYAWLASDPYTVVTGLTDWDTLASSAVTTSCPQDENNTENSTATASASVPDAENTADATATAATDEDGCTVLENSGANPADSDLWLTTKTGTGSATLELDTSGSDLVALVATDGTSNAPQLTLSWPRHVSTPWLIPGLILGGLLLLVGVFLFLIDIQVRHADEQRRARAADRAARMAQADSVATVGIPSIGDPNRPLTRREQRDKERAERTGEEWIDPRTGAVYRGGVEAPAVPEASPASDAVEASGPARGSAVVPGLDAQATAAHRSTRELDTGTPFAVSGQEIDGAQQPAEHVASETAEFSWEGFGGLSEYARTSGVDAVDAYGEPEDGASGTNETTDESDQEHHA